MWQSSKKLFVVPKEVGCSVTKTPREIQPILEPKTAVVQLKTSSYRRRAIQSKGAILVLVICTCVDVGKLSALNQLMLTLFQPQSPFTLLSTFISISVGVAIPQLFYPLAGWLADARFGRHRVIQISLWCVWLGECTLSVSLLLFDLCQSYSKTYHDVFIYFCSL